MSEIIAYVRQDVRRWSAAANSSARDWPLPRLLAAKEAAGGAPRISVVLPAHNEAATIGAIVATLRRDLDALVDELIVVDSASTDGTSAAARSAGAGVVRLDLPGKGRALCAGLAATSSELVAFLDADLCHVDGGFVTGLVGPLLIEPRLGFVKASYTQPAGRVTELVARPLLALHWPHLAGFTSPLAGEYAGRRQLLETCAFEPGYGVDLGLLLDAAAAVGLPGLAQVDLGRRLHRHHGDPALGRMAAEVWAAAGRRLGLVPAASTLVQFEDSRPRSYEISAHPLPPVVGPAARADQADRAAS